MLVLAIDTCDAWGSVALVEEKGAEEPGQAGAGQQVVLGAERHETDEGYSTWLLPAVQRALDRTGRRLTDVELYAAAAGPGSFTGIRIALTTVKAWNEVFGRPIAAVSRLAVLAALASDGSGPGEAGPQFVAASCDAQRGQLYAAVFRRDGARSDGGSRWSRLGDERVVNPGELIQWAGEEAGEAGLAWVSLNPDSLTDDPLWLGRGERGERVEKQDSFLAPAIAKIAFELAERNELTNALALDANYIRRPDAEVKWKGYSRPVV